MINFDTFFKVSYGLYIVTSGDRRKGNGFISNSVFQVTAEPPQFAVCCNKENYTAGIIRNTGTFVICILGQKAGKEIIGTFGYRSGRDINKIDNVSIIFAKTGVPIVTDDIVAYIECKLVNTFDVGSHLIFIGKVVSAEKLSEDEPMTYDYYRNVKKGIAPKNAPTYIDKSKLTQKNSKVSIDKYKCPTCGYIYDPNKGDINSDVKSGTLFRDLHETWVCPLCGTGKKEFYKI